MSAESGELKHIAGCVLTSGPLLQVSGEGRYGMLLSVVVSCKSHIVRWSSPCASLTFHRAATALGKFGPISSVVYHPADLPLSLSGILQATNCLHSHLFVWLNPPLSLTCPSLMPISPQQCSWPTRSSVVPGGRHPATHHGSAGGTARRAGSAAEEGAAAGQPGRGGRQ